MSLSLTTFYRDTHSQQRLAISLKEILSRAISIINKTRCMYLNLFIKKTFFKKMKEYYILPLESSMACETSLVVMVQNTGKNFTFKKNLSQITLK